VPSEEHARRNVLARQRGFANAYQERKVRERLNLGDAAGRAAFHDYQQYKGSGVTRSTMEQYASLRDKMDLNRDVNYHGDRISWDQFAQRRGIIPARLTEAGREAGAHLPSRSYDPYEVWGEDYEEFYDYDWDEWWRGYEED